MIVRCGHISDSKINVKEEYETFSFWDDDGALWFEKTGKSIRLEGRKFLGSSSSNWALVGEDKPTEIGSVSNK